MVTETNPLVERLGCLNRAQLAREIQVSKTTISKYLNPAREDWPSLHMARLIADALDVTVNDLVDAMLASGKPKPKGEKGGS